MNTPVKEDNNVVPTGRWNHNVHYQHVVLRSIPPNCGRALDVGCGKGLFTEELARHCREVIGIDTDGTCLSHATPAATGLTFLEAEVMTYPFEPASFDLVVAVAALHHLPLNPALTRFKDLLRPGGALAVIGLYRASTPLDFLLNAVALPVSRMLRLSRGYSDVGAPLQEPQQTLREIRAACQTLLPGAVLRRRLLFRYSLIWQKPTEDRR